MWAMWPPRPGPPPPNGETLSCMHLDSSSKPSPARLFLLDLLDILRLRVWMPSFFMVRVPVHMNTRWMRAWLELKGSSRRQILISVTDAVTLNDSPTLLPLRGATPPIETTMD
ncbi:hypothetical protein EYF80_042947 [Liparis tanakae]|uniref:Uncharacterized protein n=1 Tax=Liparis tanakae TaxID=230148 RepID=A0A4Z2FZT8_9TELE|nr:hypothetical protein EYF80_042947 [Liparis tanakae]